MRSPLQGGRVFIGLAAVGAVLAVGGVASATMPGAGGSYTACQSRAGGVLRMIDPSLRGSQRRRSHCLSSETKITWSKRGSAGRTGASGLRGAAGEPGAPSTPSVAGLAGAAGAPGASGSPGATGPAGNPGASGGTGATGPSGATGTIGPGAVSAFSGHVVAVPTTSAGSQSAIFGAPVGMSSGNTQEAPVETLSPSLPITVQDLEVSETGPPVPAADQIVISVHVNGLPSISCVMSAGATSCGSGSQSASVPAGSTLSVAIQANANLGTTIFPFDLLFGFAATSS